MSSNGRIASAALAAAVVFVACSPSSHQARRAEPSPSPAASSSGSVSDEIPLPSGDQDRAPDAPSAGSSSTRRGTGSHTEPSPGPSTPRASTPGPSSPPAEGPKCPNPKSCDIYEFIDGPLAKGWRPDPDGIARIHYWINPEPPIDAEVTAEQIEGAIKASIRTWEKAVPSVKFVYQGRTTRVPRQGDGFTDFAVGTNVLWANDRDGYTVEADILSQLTNNDLSWTPCEQRDNSCTPTGSGIDMQHVLTHELGHVLGLADLRDEKETRELTMGYPPDVHLGDRRYVTLGLGDILGVRALHPCSCPLPPIYSP